MALTVLALRAAGMGDLLAAVPALHGLSQWAAGPGAPAEVHLAAPRWLHPLAGLIPGLAGAVDVAGLRPLVRCPVDVAVNLHGSGPQSHRALLAVHPARLVGFAHPEIGWPGPSWGDPEEPERERWCRLLAWAGIAADPDDYRIDAPDRPSSAPGAVLLHLGASDDQRRWPTDRFAALAAALSDEPLAITGTASDAAAAATVARAGRVPAERRLAGRLDLLGLAATVAQARVVVSGDTGVAHLAAALGVPTVVVFGPASPKRWGPPPNPAMHRVLRGPGRAPAAAEVPVPPVLDAVRQLLQHSMTRSGG